MKKLWTLYILIYCHFNIPTESLDVIMSDNNICHHGIMKIFNWCEQSECRSCNCTSSERVCKQICSYQECDTLTCRSPLTCHQTTLAYTMRVRPTVNKLISNSPRTHQECSHGYCKHMESIRYKNTNTISFQSCSEGKCDTVRSNADHAQQFCGDCNEMTCAGKHAKNCTQLCVLGTCNKTICSAKNCNQKCLHDSNCNLTCTSDVDICYQSCVSGSNCHMHCDAKICIQKCEPDSKTCVKYKTKTTTTTSATPITTIKKTTLIKLTTKPSSSQKLEINLYYVVIALLFLLINII